MPKKQKRPRQRHVSRRTYRELERHRRQLAKVGTPGVNKLEIALALGVGSTPSSGRVMVSAALLGRIPMPRLLDRIDDYLAAAEANSHQNEVDK